MSDEKIELKAYIFSSNNITYKWPNDGNVRSHRTEVVSRADDLSE